jgi:hypothetical protein
MVCEREDEREMATERESGDREREMVRERFGVCERR